jgi:hypothetical protein
MSKEKSPKPLSIEDILKHNIFKQIDKAVSDNNYEKAFGLLDMPIPLEWTTLGTSEVTGQQYRYLPIDVLEALVERVFSRQFIETSSIETSITQTNNSAVVTTTVRFEYGFDCYSKKVTVGVASVYIEDNFHWKDGKMILHTNSKPIKALQQLTTATPLSLTEAKKNAIKNIANIFGRNLNRNVVEALPVIEIEEPVIPLDKEIQRMIELINTCTDIEELFTYKVMAYSKGISLQYDSKLKELEDARNYQPL